jgi:spectinomycin phosphotransferase
VRDRPAGVGERELRSALADGWGIQAAAMRYAAVGGGGYHWVVRDAENRRVFVTADDLDSKGWLGQTRAAVFEGLRAAMDTALALRSRAGLRFVVGPIPALCGQTVWRLGPKYAMTVFPFLNGTAGRFGEAVPAEERRELVDMLAALHRSTPAVAGAPVCAIGLPRRGALEAALRELGEPWHGGTFGEPARAILAGAGKQIRHLLHTFDELADRVAAAARQPVITHGEPHPANFIRAGDEPMLIDWDTVGLAPPERDLWMVIGDDGGEARRYTNATGWPVNPAALAFYRLRWALDDISVFVRLLRSGHRRTADTEHAWLGLKETVARTATGWPMSSVGAARQHERISKP